MTNDEFRQWRERHFRFQLACARAMGWDVETVAALETGIARRSGKPYPVKTHHALACAAWTMGIRSDYAGGQIAVMSAATRRMMKKIRARAAE